MRIFFYYFCAVLSIGIIVFTFLKFYTPSPGGELLTGFGWEFDPRPVETAELIIPDEFDEVYSEYNELQKIAGLNLEPFKGKRASRYTYIITNYPDSELEIHGNVLVVDGKAVGGDICTVNANGFMHSLAENFE